jgi:hypothetical protein
MEQKALSKWLKIIVVGVGLCGLAVYFLILPAFGQSIVYDYPEFKSWYLPWLIFLWTTGIPCYTALVFGWKIAANIGADKSFSMENAKLLKWISWLAAGDSIFFFVGNVAMLLAGMSHPGVALGSLLVVFAGVAVTVAAAALSHLVKKAAALQEESDLTI